MRSLAVGTVLIAALGGSLSVAQAQQPAAEVPADQRPFVAGEPLAHAPNIRTFGSFRFAESITYDETRDLYVVSNGGIGQDLVQNDGYVSLINPDGTVHTLKWIGATRDGLTLNHPLGSDIANGLLYLADIDTIRTFDLATGEPRDAIPVEGADRFNDIEVTDAGVIYATQTGNADGTVPWRLYRIDPDNEDTRILVEGAPLNRPNGVAFDPDGNLVVVNLGSLDVLTFSPEGELLATETSTDPGNDGLVILADGTKYVSSVQHGTVARIRPGEPAEEIASGIPSAASMTYDPTRNRLLIPQNNWDAITFVDLE